MRKRFTSTRQAARMLGYRSGLEEQVAEELKTKNIDFLYEQEKISYIVPESNHKYAPDFKMNINGHTLYIETKGIFAAADRKKHVLIKEQHPDLDIRFLFQNANTRISKNSKTTYAMWCEKHGFQYASKTIPDSWLI